MTERKETYVFDGFKWPRRLILTGLVLLALPFLGRVAERFVLRQIDAFEWQLDVIASGGES